MRLHRLTVTAFGPFAGTETVDFDDLNDAGLFLLTGPTGAGKSSLLDAVCFALYGQVPGVRGVKALKSQHAAVDVPPEVVLDFSVRDRRFVVRRTPEWSRPKKRGDGLLAEKASASITETTGGADHFLSARAAEVGLLVSDLMGMNASQFVQVALLPQGEFQTFLRASSQERHAVLQHLFRTDRFARIEDWVHDHSRDLKLRSGRDEADVQRLLDGVADRAGVPTPEDLTGDDLAQAASDGRVVGWALDRLTDARAVLDTATLTHTVAGDAVAAALDRHADAVRAREVAARVAAAHAELAALDASEDRAVVARATLDAAERAATCRPLLTLLDQAESAATQAELGREQALGSLSQMLASPGFPVAVDEASVGSAGTLVRLLRDTRARATRLETLLPREAAGTLARRELVAARTRLGKAETELAETADRAEQLPAELLDLVRRLQEAASRAARHEALTLSLETALRRRTAARGLVAAEVEVRTLADAHREARDHALTAREHRQDLLARRLTGMAAELAGALADGDPCQVCGSPEHPAPALPSDDAVTESDQRTADAEVARRSEQVDLAARALADAEHRRADCAAAAEGRTAADAADEVDAVTAELADAEQARDEERRLSAAVDRTRAEQESVAARQSAAAAEIAGLQQTVTGLEVTVREVDAELADVTPGSLREAVQTLTRVADRVEDVRRVVDEADRTLGRAVDLRAQTADAAREHDFDSVDAVRAALLDTADQRQLRALLEERDRVTRRARETLAESGHDVSDPDDPVADPVADLAALEADLAAARSAEVQASRAVHLAEACVEAVTALLARLEAAVTAWAPLRDESLRAEAMSQLVRGLGQDNQLQMRLSAYVLATRLDQVVAAANERLGHMRDQRYLLQRTDRAARKGSQAGLGLEVVDQWTGDARAPSTLSGGETFVVSLSLALGLADVVTQEAGGTEIETLFVDEGFGTLDADTLDDVMDRLDGLRAGGRTVGVVSHVSELRNRIPTQVHVRKGRSGSSIDVTTLVG